MKKEGWLAEWFVIEHLHSKHNVLSSNPITAKKKRKRAKKGKYNFSFLMFFNVARCQKAYACNPSYSGGRDQEVVV
jgi:hypothetical protein